MSLELLDRPEVENERSAAYLQRRNIVQLEMFKYFQVKKEDQAEWMLANRGVMRTVMETEKFKQLMQEGGRVEEATQMLIDAIIQSRMN